MILISYYFLPSQIDSQQICGYIPHQEMAMRIPQEPEGGWEAVSLPNRPMSQEAGEALMAKIGAIAQSDLFLIWLWARAEHCRIIAELMPDEASNGEAKICLDVYRFIRDGGLTWTWWNDQEVFTHFLGKIVHEYQTFLSCLRRDWAERHGVAAMTDEAYFYFVCRIWRDQADLDWLGRTGEQIKEILNPVRER